MPLWYVYPPNLRLALPCPALYCLLPSFFSLSLSLTHTRAPLALALLPLLVPVFFGFGWETCDHVLGNGAIRDDLPYLIDKGHILLSRMLPVHFFQDPGASALHRKVNVITDIFMSGHTVKHIFGHILRIAGRETNSHVRLGSCDHI